MTDANKTPWSSEAEQSVLGALLIDNGAIDRISELKADAFFDGANRRVFVAILSLVNSSKPADVITVFERLQATGELDDAGGLAYLNALAQSVPSSSNITRYAAIVMERAKARALMAAGSAAIEAATDQATPIDERIEKVSAGLMRLLEQGARQDSVSLADLLVQHTQTLEDRDAGKVSGMPTGLIDIDNMLGGGLARGEVMIIGARPSMGKTALMLTIGMQMATTYGVGMLSMEMPRGAMADRSVSLLGRVPLDQVMRPTRGAGGAFWDRVLAATEEASARRLYIDDQGALTISQVRAKARAMKRKHGIDVLLVDYLQLMSGTDAKQNRTYQLEEITRGLKALAKELGICVVVLSQINRRVDERPDAMPGMSDLKDSGAIEQDADVILFLHRPIHTKPDLGDEWKHYTKVFIAKNRQGETGLLDLAYFGEETRFTSWSGAPPTQSPSHQPKKREHATPF